MGLLPLYLYSIAYLAIHHEFYNTYVRVIPMMMAALFFLIFHLIGAVTIYTSLHSMDRSTVRNRAW
jgi:hypothetical protein